MTRYHHAMRFALIALVLAGCPAPKGGARPYPEPTVADIVARLGKAHDDAKSFRADSTMDFWIGNQRTKGEVLVMGKAGSFMRIAALSPAGGSTMAEMACDGLNFVYVNYQNNCVVTGPCDRMSIAQFFHVELTPDDFLHLAIGTPPVVPNATGTITWDGSKGLEQVVLAGGGGHEKLALDMQNGKLDVMSAEMIDPDGKSQWSMTNSAFVDVGGHRVPGKSRFKAPGEQQDLEIDWGDAKSRAVNLDLGPEKFQLVAPAGLATCGAPPKP